MQPFLNGDRPDLVILNPNVGLMVFEVKDWVLDHYSRDEGGHRYFVTDSRGTYPIPSPVKQVERYRENLVKLYIPELGEEIDTDTNKLALFKVGLYFHNSTTERAIDFIKHAHCTVIGHNALLKENLCNIVPDVRWAKSKYMRVSWANLIRVWLKPPYHSIEQGQDIKLSTKQKDLATPAPKKHQRLRGVAGSGKTLVIAQRAANLASQGKTVLVITFNITLWHFIRDYVSRARHGFSWSQITFIHFHGYCRNFLNENGIMWPTIPDTASEKERSEMFSTTVPNLVLSTLRSGKNEKCRKYDAILIDEAQDYEFSYYDTLCAFLSENDEVLLVADEKQNIYERELSWLTSMKGTKFRGRWRELEESYRLPVSILKEANRFAQDFLPDVGVRAIPSNYRTGLFDPHLIWRNISSFEEGKKTLMKCYEWLTKTRYVHPSEIVILVQTHKEGWDLVALFESINVKANHVFEDESKTHHNKQSFWMGDGRLKISTIHSFKGWELKNVILFNLEQDSHASSDNKDFLLYIAITRSTQNLIVLNACQKYVAYGEGWQVT